jgi:diaminopimelate decarboxylase
MDRLKYIKDIVSKCIVPEEADAVYFYIKDIVRENLGALRNALAEKSEVFYAMKANPDPQVVSYLKSLGCGVDVASSGELLTALEAGIPGSKISFAGPGKTDQEIALAVKSNICSISIENAEEIDKIDLAASSNGTKQGVSLRINPEKKFGGYGIKMGGLPSQFGMDVKQTIPAIEKIKKSKALDLVGFHMHVGSQILDAAIMGDAVEYLIDYALGIKKDLGVDVRSLNFGGGFGIVYHDDQKPLNMGLLRNALKEKTGKPLVKQHLGNVRFVFEPGRFLTGPAGVYVSKVLYIKSSFNKNFIVMAGGMHHNMAPTGNLGQIIRRNYFIDILRIGRPEEPGQLKKYDIVGPLCTPLDKLASDIMLSDVRVGDYVLVFNSGAYGYSASPVNFLSHPLPQIKVI